ncbi:hypothetical protein HaLaN_21142 [Haematococcus lacustris]|uniref:Uncharacterized protein n=1 Tax=Haematococcus lacustris TaxID=44745 RepID=A0A699ZV72_HAELA|nr:hypothetical protein HaLaN_21142 [Haematococcus lacustris]
MVGEAATLPLALAAAITGEQAQEQAVRLPALDAGPWGPQGCCVKQGVAMLVESGQCMLVVHELLALLDDLLGLFQSGVDMLGSGGNGHPSVDPFAAAGGSGFPQAASQRYRSGEGLPLCCPCLQGEGSMAAVAARIILLWVTPGRLLWVTPESPAVDHTW